MLLLITSRTTSFEKSCVCAYLPIYFLPTCMKLKWQRLDLQSWWWWPTILQILLNVMFYRLPEYIPCWTVVLSWNSFSICRHTSCHLVMKVHVLEVIVCICVVHVCMCVCACVCVCCDYTSMALVSMRVSRKGIFSGNFSLVMATSKQSPKSMCRIRPVRRSNIRLEGCLKLTNQKRINHHQ